MEHDGEAREREDVPQRHHASGPGGPGSAHDTYILYYHLFFAVVGGKTAEVGAVLCAFFRRLSSSALVCVDECEGKIGLVVALAIFAAA